MYIQRIGVGMRLSGFKFQFYHLLLKLGKLLNLNKSLFPGLENKNNNNTSPEGYCEDEKK